MIEAPARTQALPETPYVGLVPYREEDADFFFGRDEDRQIVAGNLRASRLTILYGSSGVGKTSLLEAGVVHDLHRQVLANAAAGRERPPFAVCSFRAWRDDPLPALVGTIRAAAVEALGGEELPAWHPGEPLVDTLGAWTERVRTLLVVLDQFEDYFLYHADEDGEGTFAGEFPQIVNEPNLRVNFLLSIREDAWAKLDRFEGRIPRLFANYVRVEHLDREAAREAINGPVTEWNRRLPDGAQPYRVEPALVAAVVEATAAGRLALGEGDGAAPETAADDAIEAPFLQLVMERLWRATAAAGSHELTRAQLDGLGGAQQIVDNHLRDALAALSRDEKAVAADVFRYLVTRSKTKIAHSASDLAEWTGRTEPEAAAVLERLCRGESGRILRAVQPATEGEAMRYELFHDVLAEPILQWRRGYEHRRARARLGAIAAALVALVAVFAALGVWALVQRRDARRQSDLATSVALASIAQRQLPDHPDKALLFALEAYRTRSTGEAESSMISALEAVGRSGVTTILRPHSDVIWSVAFSPDGRTLAVGGDATVLWDTATWRRLRTFGGCGEKIAFSPDGGVLACAGFDDVVRLWDVRSGRTLRRLDGDSAAFSPHDGMLAVGAPDGIELWDSTARARRRLIPYRGQGTLTAVAFSPDGRTLVTGSGVGELQLWSPVSGRPLSPLMQLGDSEIDHLAFAADGSRVVIGSDSPRFLDVATHALLPLGRNVPGLSGIAFSRDGRILAAGTDTNEGVVRLWDARTMRPLETLGGLSTFVSGVAFSPDGRMVAAGSGDGTVRLWRLPVRPRLPERIVGSGGAHVSTIAFAGGAIVSGSPDGWLRVWDAGSGMALEASRLTHAGRLRSVAVSSDRQTVAAAIGHVIELWDLRTRKPLGLLRGHTRPVRSVAFSVDGRTLASGGNDGTIRLWDVRTRTELRPPIRRPTAVFGVAFSPDGRILAALAQDALVSLLDARTRKPLRKARNLTRYQPTSMAFSGDGGTLAVSARNVSLWDTRRHRSLGQPLRGPDLYSVQSVAFSPDGRIVAAAIGDGTVRLWDVRTHTPLGQPLRGSAVQLAFSPDGRTLAAAGGTDGLLLWNGVFWHDGDDLRTRVCDMVAGNLTKAEWDELASGFRFRTSCPR